MSQEHKIVFLHERSMVPQLIIDMAHANLPSGFSLELVEEGASAEHRLEKIAGADFILGYPGDPTVAELDAAPDLKLLQILSAGYEFLDLDMYRSRGLPVANNGGANAPTVAEHAIMLILAVFKKLPLHHNSMLEGEWLEAQETLNMRELRGKTLGILGFGRIGREVAGIARGFQTKTLYFDTVAASPEVERELAAEPASLDELFERSDIVTVHTNLTDESRGLVNARTLALMKPTAIVVNTSRGPAVNEAALLDALRDGKIAGAGLDVFISEPLEADSGLRGFPTVVHTPHIAGVTLDTWSRRISFGFGNIARVAAGQPPESVIT